MAFFDSGCQAEVYACLFMHVAGIRDTLSAYQSLKQRLAFHLTAITVKKVKLNILNYSPSHP